MHLTSKLILKTCIKTLQPDSATLIKLNSLIFMTWNRYINIFAATSVLCQDDIKENALEVFSGAISTYLTG